MTTAVPVDIHPEPPSPVLPSPLMTTTAYPLRTLVDHGDGRAPAYRIEIDAEAEIVGIARAAGRGPDGPGVAVLVTTPTEPSTETKPVDLVVVPVAADIDAVIRTGWTATALGALDDQLVCQVEPAPDWRTPQPRP